MWYGIRFQLAHYTASNLNLIQQILRCWHIEIDQSSKRLVQRIEFGRISSVGHALVVQLADKAELVSSEGHTELLLHGFEEGGSEFLGRFDHRTFAVVI